MEAIEKSVHARLSTALGQLEKMTGDASPPTNEAPRTVEEAVGRMMQKVADQGSGTGG